MEQILIVGAGPTGLTAALALALHQHGLRPRIVEKHTTPSPLSRAVGLLPSSMAIFGRLGVADKVREAAVTIALTRLYCDGRLLAELPMDTDPDPNVRLLSLPQDRTEAILAQALSDAGIPVDYGVTAEQLSDPLDAPKVVLNGEETRYQEVLGADGAQSIVRGALGLEKPGFELPEEWSIADVDVAEPVDPAVEIRFMGDADAVFLVPMEAQRVRLVSNTPNALARFGDGLPITHVRREGTFRIEIRQVNDYRHGHVSLAGDAAHTHSPVGGRGMNLGIADAAEWADRLAAGTLDGYSASRHAAGAHTISLSETVRTTVLGGNALKRTLAFLALRVANRFPPLAARIRHQIILG